MPSRRFSSVSASGSWVRRRSRTGSRSRWGCLSRLDEAAFAAFHARTSRALRAYVFRVVGNASDADDIVQEAFLRMLRADAPAENDEHLRRYLYRVASNLIVDRWRRRKHEEGGEAMPEPMTAPARYEEDAAVAKIFAELQ